MNKYPNAIITETKPYRVRTSCGHVVIRKMREATAGVPYAPEVLLEAPEGLPCPACQAGQPPAKGVTQ